MFAKYFLGLSLVGAFALGLTSTACFSDPPPPPTGLPCDVANALASCQSCHGPTPLGGAPLSLVTLADLTTVAADGRTEAEHAVDRMNGTPTPMPPLPLSAPAQADIDTLQAWITAGFPGDVCAPPAGGPTPYDTALACTSGHTGTTAHTTQMRPGEACIACHQTNNGPIVDFMGTIYPTAHEPDDCVGASFAGVQVIAIDANNMQYPMTPNSVGTFYGPLSGSATMPYTIKITYQNRERDMVTPQTSGDCNSCHTADGTNGAPGRVMLP